MSKPLFFETTKQCSAAPSPLNACCKPEYKRLWLLSSCQATAATLSFRFLQLWQFFWLISLLDGHAVNNNFLEIACLGTNSRVTTDVLSILDLHPTQDRRASPSFLAQTVTPGSPMLVASQVWLSSCPLLTDAHHCYPATHYREV